MDATGAIRAKSARSAAGTAAGETRTWISAIGAMGAIIAKGAI